MIPVAFPQANRKFGAAEGFSESQIMTIPAYVGEVKQGSVDGSVVVVVAWSPTPEEIEDLKAGKPVYLSMMNGLLPHFLTTRFEQATNPA